MTITFWGPMFPVSGAYWDGHFPDGGQDPSVISGFGPAGSADFTFSLEAGFKVTYKWVTDIIKKYDGSEQRIAVNDAPKQFYNGDSILLASANEVRTFRSNLARYMALGATFLLGLPHEELTLVADANNKIVFVNDTYLGYCDWKHPGQRVFVVDQDGNHVSAVLQSTASGQITLDIAPGSIGRAGAKIMPAMPVLLEPKQGFSRYPQEAEVWHMDARAAIFDFAPELAAIPLSFLSAPFANAVATARVPGLSGESLTLEFNGSAGWPATGQLIETGPLTLFRYKPGVTTLQNLADALVTSSNFILTGTWNPVATFGAFDDMFVNAFGGGTSGDWGNGATLATYRSKPVWDLYLQAEGAVGDSIQALTEIIDMDGVPYSVATAAYADWGRQINVKRPRGLIWQWFKKFMTTVNGRQKSFWLPTWRNDLTFVSAPGGFNIVVSSTDGSDLFAWWPGQRQDIQIVQLDGTLTRARINTVVDNGDGTYTLTLDTVLGIGQVLMISWLELCRFDSDDFEIEFYCNEFRTELLARVVQS